MLKCGFFLLNILRKGVAKSVEGSHPRINSAPFRHFLLPRRFYYFF